MLSLSSLLGLLLAITASVSPSTVDAFSPIVSSHIRRLSFHSFAYHPLHRRMTEEDVTDDRSSDDDEVITAIDEGKKEKEPDPEVVELNEKISKLESEIRRKKGQLTDLKEISEKYSQAGYVRQVALVENNKRRRGASMSDSKFAARASVIQSFLPVLDELDMLGSKYKGNSFASTLGALGTGFRSSLQELGVTEYTVEVGSKLDVERVLAIEEEHSDEFSAGTVISPVKLGLEIQGNVIRPAECVVSLGCEKSAEKESDETPPIEASGGDDNTEEDEKNDNME